MSHGVVRNGIYYKQEKEKDKLRMGGGSWSINLDEINLGNVHTIVYCTEKEHYIISSESAGLHGFQRMLGGEIKLVVPIRHWKVQVKDDSTRETIKDN